MVYKLTFYQEAVRKSLLQKDKELGAYDADPGQIGIQRRTTHTQNDFSLGEVFSTKGKII